MCLRADWLPALSYQRSKLTNCSLIRLSLIFFPQEIRIFYSDKAEKFQPARRPNPRGFPPPAARRSPRLRTPGSRRRGGGKRRGRSKRTGGRRDRGAEGSGVEGRLRARQGEPEAAARGGVGVWRSGGLTAYLQPDLPGAPVRHATPRVVGCKRGQRRSLRRRDPGRDPAGTARSSPAPALPPRPPRGAPRARPPRGRPAPTGRPGSAPGSGASRNALAGLQGSGGLK